MTIRNRPSGDWYKRKIMEIGDVDIGAGPICEEDPVPTNAPLNIAFGALVQLERRSRNLTVEAMADALDIAEDDLRNIEHNPTYRAGPRTIINIAKGFDLPARELMKLSGAAASNDTVFEKMALKFAAHSDVLGKLTSEERQLLNEFVQFLKGNH